MNLIADYKIEQISKTSAGEVVKNFFTDEKKGLSEQEAIQRLKESGLNVVGEHKNKNEFLQLLSHFNSPLIIILLIASVVSFSVGETVNASIIVAMLLMGVVIDYWQEHDARNAAEKLKQTVKTRAVVVRDGVEKEIIPDRLCAGDIVLLNAGRIVPADARVLFAKDFFINQSSLTGESFPCEKYFDAIPDASADLTSLDNIAFMGTSVTTGTAKAVVVKIAGNTEFGKIAEKLVAREEETDFSRGMRHFGFLIMRITIVLVLFIFLVNAWLGHRLLESFLFSLAVAVGLTPELLPMVMSVAMSKGSLRMAKKGVIVKRLSAIPNFGSMEVLCTDKTGTITEDKIKLIKYVDATGKTDENLFLLAFLNSHFQTGIKNPLDDAILSHRLLDVAGYTKTDEVPFDFSRKRMSVVVEKEGKCLFICKGAPEEIFKVSTNENSVITEANRQYELLSTQGFRVLAIASKQVPKKTKFTKQDEEQLSLNGFIAFLDPPKEDAGETIAELAKIGVEVKIITGDNELVTQNVCRQIGLPIKGSMQGYEMEQLTDDALSKRAVSTTIFTRFSPGQKNRVIEALKKYYHAVGYMGDGINDAPSLKTADIGISVNTATDVAREAADIILTRKDLLVLKEGILEGRKTFGNTMKYILMGLSSNFGNMFSVAAATLFLPFLPMLPAQILVNNFLYDTSQLTIPSDNVDESYIQKPQSWNLKMIRSYMLIFGLVSSAFDLITFYLFYKYFALSEAQFQTGWFLESLATQILVVFIIRTNRLPFIQSLPGKFLVISALACLAAGWILPYLGVGRLMGFEPLPARIIVFISCVVVIYLFCAELVKRFIYQRLLARAH